MYIVTEIASVKKMTLLDLFILYFTQTVYDSSSVLKMLKWMKSLFKLMNQKKKKESQNIKWTQKFLKIEIEWAMSNEQISHNRNTDTKATVIP